MLAHAKQSRRATFVVITVLRDATQNADKSAISPPPSPFYLQSQISQPTDVGILYHYYLRGVTSSSIRTLKIVKHVLFHFLYLNDKVQATKQQISTIFAIFSFNFPKIMVYPPAPSLPYLYSELKIADFPGLCVASLMCPTFQ